MMHVDYHEAALIEIIKNLFPEGNNYITTNTELPCGDIQFVVDGDPVLVVERKTLQDLLSSILSNRFREQRANMLLARQQHPNIGLCFVIEGDASRLYMPANCRLSVAKLKSIMNRLYPIYQIAVVWTQDAMGTFTWLAEIQDRYLKSGSPARILSLVTEADRVLAGNKRRVKPEFYLQSALSLINGVSPERAKLLAEHYGTLANLMECYRILARPEDCELMLKDFIVPGQKKHLGRKLSKLIYHSIYGMTAPPVQPPSAPPPPQPVRPPSQQIPKRKKKVPYATKQSAITNIGGKMKFK